MIAPAKKISTENALDIYKDLLLPRLIEEKMLNLLRQNKISKWFSGIGQEAISVAVGRVLDEDDYIFPMHRNLGIFTTRKVPLYNLFCQLMGRADGYTGGRDRSFHFGIPEKKIFGMISHLAATMPVAAGVALANKLRDNGNIALSFCGDGATSEGDFHEACNLTAVWNLPVVFLIENNGYGLSTPTSEQYACENLVDRAAGYGMKGIHVNGNNYFEMQQAIEEAKKSALNGTPVLIEALTFRMRGHEEASGTFYIPDEKFEVWKKKDPILLFENWMRDEGILKGDDQKINIRNEIKEIFASDLENALNAPLPSFDEQAELNRAELSTQPKSTVNGKSYPSSEKRMVDAIKFAHEQAFDNDESFILMGQDIAEYGGVFKVSEGFLERYGKGRVRNTPIIESGIIGAAIGLAMEGFKPVVELQFADFISCGFNQIVNNLSKGRYRWMPDLNVTLRAPHGGGVAAGPFHSQSPESWFMQLPGMRVLVPSSVADAQNMLYTSLFDPNPVLFFEHKKLYRSIKDTTEDHCRFVDLSKANVVKEGSDLTIITYGMGVHWALDLLPEYDEKGITIELVDLRSLAPIDWETVTNSVIKTGKVLLLQEPSEILGPMSEISAGITERVFGHLDAPVMRCSSLHTPIPFSRELENGYMANFRLKEKIEALLEY